MWRESLDPRRGCGGDSVIRAGVFIGVDRTGDLPQLRDAALGRCYGLVTPGDLLATYYDDSRRVRVLSAVVGIAVLFPYAAIQLAGIAAVAGATDNAVPYTAGLLIVAISVGLYSVFRGARAIVWTDVIRGFIFALVLLATSALVVGWAGGWTDGWQQAIDTNPDKMAFTGDTAGAYFTTMLLWTFGWVLTPHLWGSACTWHALPACSACRWCSPPASRCGS